MEKILTVVIPAYNVEKYLSDTLTSFLDDSVLEDIEVLVVDDGSKDSTSKICHEHNYNIIDLPINLGLTGAFQTG